MLGTTCEPRSDFLPCLWACLLQSSSGTHLVKVGGQVQVVFTESSAHARMCPCWQNRSYVELWVMHLVQPAALELSSCYRV